MTLKPPLDFRVDIAPGAEPDADPVFWSWLDISSYRRQSENIGLNYGRDDESDETEPADSSFTVDLRDGLLSPRNPNSALYGQIGSGTPIRYRLPIATDTFTRTTSNGWGASDTGQTWTNTSSVLSVSGGVGKAALAAANTAVLTWLNDTASYGVDFRYSVSLSAVTTGNVWVSAVLIRATDTSNAYRLHMEFRTDGSCSLKIVRVYQGAEVTLQENLATGITYTANQKKWVRVQAVGAHIRAKVWSGALTDEPLLFQANVTDGYLKGGMVGFYQWRLAGNTNVGTLTASIDDVQVDAVIWSGNVPEFPPRWDKSGNDATATLAAAGPLRRLLQGDAPVQSALRSQLPSYAPAGYWPIEDQAGATQASSAIVNGIPASVTGDISFGNDPGTMAGTSSLAKFGSSLGMTITGIANGPDTGAGFAGLIFYQFDAIPAADTTIVEWRTRGSVTRWRVNANTTGFWLQGFGGTDNAEVFRSDSTAIYPVSPLQPFSVQLETSASGGSTDYALLFNSVGDTTFYALDTGTASGLVPGTPGSAKGFYIPGSVGLYGAQFGQVWMGPNTLPYVNTSFLLVSSGYSGELATDRLTRLFTQAGKPLALGAGAGEAMGAQRPANFLDLVQEVATTDMGILYETGEALGYLPRAARYNQPVVLTLDWAAGDLAEAPEPTDDDQRLHNQITVTRTGGSSVTAQDDDSIDKHGVVPSTAEVNVASDGQLPYQAGFRVSLGSIDELRWPSISLNLIKHPEFIPAVLTLQQGSRIQIINPKTQLAGLTIDLIVEGVKMTMGRYTWDVELVCAPATPWNAIALYDDFGRYDALTSTLAEALTTTETLWDVTADDLGSCWDTVAVPYDVIVGGEQCTVTAATAATGTGPYTQTLTCTRSVNGIVKTHSAGDSIRVANPGRYAL